MGSAPNPALPRGCIALASARRAAERRPKHKETWAQRKPTRPEAHWCILRSANQRTMHPDTKKSVCPRGTWPAAMPTTAFSNPLRATGPPSTKRNNMSDEPTANSGNGRRRRSRGGRNRNRNRNRQGGENRGQNPNQNREGGGNRKSGQGGNRSRNRNRDGQGGGRRRAPKPVPLTWWQKLLKAIGLYTPPEPKGRGGKKSSKEPKSNTRDTRTGASAPDEEKSERKPRKKRERKPREERETPSTEGIDSKRLYLGNLSYEASETDLEELFRGVGSVRRVEIVYDRKTHRSKGYGFIEMLNVEEAKKAVEILHDQFFMGRKLTVSSAKSDGPAKETQTSEEFRPRDAAPEPKPAATEDAPATDEVETPKAEEAPVTEASTETSPEPAEEAAAAPEQAPNSEAPETAETAAPATESSEKEKSA